jgi:hypothetical protein
MKADLLRDLEAAALTAVESLAPTAVRRVACMHPSDIPLLLENTLADRCNDDAAKFLRGEIHRLCCERAGLLAA